MGPRRPLILQMVHDDSAVEPRCRFQEEDSEKYGNPVSSASKIADTNKTRTEALLNKTKTTVSSKLIVMRTEYAHGPNLTIIDTPGFILMAKKGEPENTPEEILSIYAATENVENFIYGSEGVSYHRMLEIMEDDAMDGFVLTTTTQIKDEDMI
ncbi:dynamin-related protein 5A-like [Papaver somniferum]|uniref:dynamin-related protein 5A-like n=1 Tax=Papaver somniferum TaxID=3469 RepID=UPI000E6FC049|nr:dynamin-related protein 5A-like [Papaver somniferum]